MSEFLGLDTSNYTTSAAVFDPQTMTVHQAKRLLPVKEGELGLRQSDAVFHHTKQLPEMVENLASGGDISGICAVSASVRPRNAEGSYMPCFLVGEGTGRCIAAAKNVPFFETSHQVGHILAALYSAGKLDLVKEKFIAFHVSGGTTDCLLCEPDQRDIIGVTELGSSLDLKAGQAVDRAGVMLGLKFPCGAELEKLAAQSARVFKVKPVIKDGSCCLSGVENKCRDMLAKGESPQDIAAFCLQFISDTIIAMTRSALEKAGSLPLVYAGGVMSDKLIRDRITAEFPDAAFAEPAFSCDNAAGVAISGWLRMSGGEVCRY